MSGMLHLHLLSRLLILASSWIGSIQLLFLLSVGLPIGRAFDRGYLCVPAHISYLSANVLLIAIILSSPGPSSSFSVSSCCPWRNLRSTTKWAPQTNFLGKFLSAFQVFLSQGLGMGLAMGMIYLPTMGVMAHHFLRKRVFVMGIVVSGASMGGVIHPIMLNKLFHSDVGFAKGVRASAGLNLGIMFLALCLMRTRLPPKNTGGLGPAVKRFARDPPYLLAVFGWAILDRIRLILTTEQRFPCDHGPILPRFLPSAVLHQQGNWCEYRFLHGKSNLLQAWTDLNPLILLISLQSWTVSTLSDV